MAKLNHPANLKYSETDEWVRVEGDEATVGRMIELCHNLESPFVL